MASRHTGRWYLFPILSILLLFTATATEAVTPDVGGLAFDASLGFGGYFRPGSWVPIQVDLANEGFPVEAAVEVVSSALNRYPAATTKIVYHRPVALPTGSRKRLNINVPITDLYSPLDVRLVQNDGTLLGAVRFPLREGGVNADLVLVLDPSGERWTWLQEVVQSARGGASQSRIYAIHLKSAEELPTDWVSYESIRTVILTDEFPVSTLSAQQIEALLQWVEAGGHLIVSGGPGLDAYRSPELISKLPVNITGGTRTISLSSLGAEYTPLPAPVTVVAWDATPGEGEVSLEAAGVPIVADRWLGTGRLTYIAFDLSSKVFRDWDSLDWFSRALAFPERMVRKANTRTLEKSLLPLLLNHQVFYPSPIWVGTFLAAYVGLFTLGVSQARSKSKRVRRTSWIIVIVAMMGITAAVPLGLAPAALKAMRAYGEIRVSQVPPGEGEAHSFAVAQIVDLHGGSWPIQRDAGVYIAPAPASGIQQTTFLNVELGDEEVVIGPTLARQPQAVTSHTLVDLPIDVTAESDNLDLQLTLTNNTDWELRSAFYVDRTRYKYLGTASARKSLVVKFPADVFVTSNAALSPEWIASSVASVAKDNDWTLRESQLEAMQQIVTFALTSDNSAHLPWGRPLVVALLESPVKPPLNSHFTGTGFHFVVIPLASALREDAF